MSTETSKSASNAPKTGINAYLILYNVASWVGWTYVLGLTLSELAQNNMDFTTVYDRVGWSVTIVQTGAILEILHVMIGFVKSPLFTTTFQVMSRLLLVWLIVDVFPEVRSHWAFSTMIIAWSITECVRYAYYGFNLVEKPPGWLLWCRYTFFFVLYPLGAGSEAMLIYQSLPYSIQLSKIYHWVEIMILLTYAPGFYIMYTHMISQRKRYLGKGKSKKME